MNIGERYALAWKLPHRIEATVVALEPDHVVVESVHRCPVTCRILQMRQTLPIEGELRFKYADFGLLFVRIPDGAIALTTSK